MADQSRARSAHIPAQQQISSPGGSSYPHIYGSQQPAAGRPDADARVDLQPARKINSATGRAVDLPAYQPGNRSPLRAIMP